MPKLTKQRTGRGRISRDLAGNSYLILPLSVLVLLFTPFLCIWQVNGAGKYFGHVFEIFLHTNLFYFLRCSVNTLSLSVLSTFGQNLFLFLFFFFFRKYQICLVNITILRNICIFNKDIVFDCGIALGWLVGLGKKKRDFPITHEVTQFKQWPFLLLCKYFFLGLSLESSGFLT